MYKFERAVVSSKANGSNLANSFGETTMPWPTSRDTEIFELIDREKERLNSGLQLIASENFTSPAVMEATGSVLTNKYACGVTTGVPERIAAARSSTESLTSTSSAAAAFPESRRKQKARSKRLWAFRNLHFNFAN